MRKHKMVYISSGLHERLETISNIYEMSKTEICEKAINEYIEKLAKEYTVDLGLEK